jgi:hypothetical protein
MEKATSDMTTPQKKPNQSKRTPIPITSNIHTTVTHRIPLTRLWRSMRNPFNSNTENGSTVLLI